MQKYKNCSHVCVLLCTTVVHNTAQNSSDYLPCYPPDKHQSSHAVYWKVGSPQRRTAQNTIWLWK